MGLLIHYSVLLLMDNQPLLHAAEGTDHNKLYLLFVFVVATPNWLQNALGDLGQSVCGLSPPLGRLLLYRLNPFSLMAIGCSISVLTAKVLIDLESVSLIP